MIGGYKKLFFLLLILLVYGCAENGLMEPEILFSINVSKAARSKGLVKLATDGLTATLSIDGGTPVRMTIDTAREVASVSIFNLTAGEHKFSVGFVKDGIVLAVGSVTETLQAGVVSRVNINRLLTNFDDDNDGFTNLAELAAGYDSSDPLSTPLFDLPPVIASSDGGVSKSGLISVNGGVGGFMSSGMVSSIDGVELYTFYN